MTSWSRTSWSRRLRKSWGGRLARRRGRRKTPATRQAERPKLNQQDEKKRTLPSRWAFLVLSAVGRILVPLEQRRRRLPGRWPQIIAIVMLVVFILVWDAWRNWLRHQIYRPP